MSVNTSLEGLLRELVRDVVREELREAILTIHAESQLRAAAPLDLPGGEEFVTVKRAGEIASVDEATVRKWLRSGALRRYVAGSSPRVRLSELHAYLSRAPDTKRALDL